MNLTKYYALICMQTQKRSCNLLPDSQKEASKNRGLCEFLDCTCKQKLNPCNLMKNTYKSTYYKTFLITTQRPLLSGEESLLIENSLTLLPENLLGDKLIPTILSTNSLLAKKINQQTNCLVEKTDHIQSNPQAEKSVKPHLVDKNIPIQVNLLAEKINHAANILLADKTTHASPIALCLDLGTQTGWALCSREGILASGSESFKGDRFQSNGIRFLKLINFLDEQFTHANNQLKIIFFEAVRRHLGVDAAHAYGGYLAHLTAWCEKNNIAYEGVPVGTIKLHATGKGNATKAMVIENIKQRNHKPVDDNEADALALAYWALENRLTGL